MACNDNTLCNFIFMGAFASLKYDEEERGVECKKIGKNWITFRPSTHQILLTGKELALDGLT